MLRVSSDTTAGQRWTLCGRLAGPSVEELRRFWLEARARGPQAPAVVDLRDVIFIDEAGEALLAEMQSAGTQFVAAGVENKHLVECLKHRGERALRRETNEPCPEAGAREGGDKK